MPRCANGTRKNKKTGACEPYRKNSPKKSSPKTRKSRTPKRQAKKHLSDAEIDSVISMTGTQAYASVLRPQLAKLTYNSRYISCFGDKLTNLFDQAVDRVQCWRKYGATGVI